MEMSKMKQTPEAGAEMTTSKTKENAKEPEVVVAGPTMLVVAPTGVAVEVKTPTWVTNQTVTAVVVEVEDEVVEEAAAVEAVPASTATKKVTCPENALNHENHEMIDHP